jgi:hypothetical protein
MSDINFDCPKCGQNLDAPTELAGLFVECPACANVVKVPSAAERHAPPPAPPEEGINRPAPVTRPTESGDEEKGSTMRINLPPDLGVPEKRNRKIIIKRMPGH